MENLAWSIGLGLAVGILPALQLFARKSTGASVLAVVVVVANMLVAWLIKYFGMPAHVGPWLGLTWPLILLGVVNTKIAIAAASSDSEHFNPVYAWIHLSITAIVILSACGLGVMSTMWFVDGDKIQMAGKVTEVDWKDIHTREIEADPRNIRIRDYGLAAWKAQQAIADSDDRGLGSRVSIGTGRIQKIDLPDGGYEQVWVFPLEHTGFWKWLNNETTPGYIRVSAERDEEAQLVETVNGQPIKQRYMEGAFFGSNLKRFVYQNGYSGIRLEDFSYEIDDTGMPFWVISLAKPTEFYGVREVLGVLVLDPQTGEMNEYSVEDAPKWVDRIYPEAIANERFKWHGRWQKGWLNGTFAQEGVLQPTPMGGFEPEAYLVVGDDGNTYWTVGMTSTNTADTALDSFVMMNSRTGQILEFRQSGINEVGAMKNINDAVSLYNGVWQAAQPIPYRVFDRLVIIAPIVAEGTRLQEIAIVDVETEKIGRGKTKSEALRNFALVIGREAPAEVDPSQGGEILALSGEVILVGSYILEGTTHVVFAVDSRPDLRFHARVTLSRDELPLLKVGDSVHFQYVDTSDDILPLRSFRVVD